MRCSARALKLLPVTTASVRWFGLSTMPSGRSLTSMCVPAGVSSWPFGTITLLAAGDIFLGGNALADGDIELTADGDILMHNATSHQSIDIDGGSLSATPAGNT